MNTIITAPKMSFDYFSIIIDQNQLFNGRIFVINSKKLSTFIQWLFREVGTKVMERLIL